MNSFAHYATALILLLSPLTVQAQAFNGNELLEKLRSKDPQTLYYIVGVVEAATATENYFRPGVSNLEPEVAAQSLKAHRSFWGCRPETASYQQVVDVTIEFLASRPRIRHLDGTMLIAFAIKNAWPCSPTQ